MSYKVITHKTAILPYVKEGIDAVASIVGRTLGPGGLPILIERTGQAANGDPLGPMITKDGVTVAAECASDDPLVDVVIQAVKDICRKTNRVAGDGPQPLYSKVLTPKGFTEMRNVEPGMEICGTQGTIQKVLGVFEKGDREIYEVEFANGRKVECCADHLWTVTDTGTTNNVLKTKTTAELVENFLIRTEEGFKHRYYTPASIAEFYTNNEEMPLDPYLVGVLLGDGSLSGSGTVEISLGLKKAHILEKLKLPEGLQYNAKYYTDKHYFRVKITGKDKNGKSIADILTSLGLLGTTSGDKFIPKSYLFSSIENRKKLLMGLIDTDGHLNVPNRFEYSSVSNQLANEFVMLCRSLGKTVSLSKYERKEGQSYSMTPIYRVTELKGYKFGDRIDYIRATGKYTAMRCIKVSNQDNLYITDDFITTHNTTTAIVLGQALLDETLKVLAHNPNLNPQQVRAQVEAAVEKAVAYLAKETVECKSFDMIEHVAAISANGDKEIGYVIRRAFEAVGTEGIVTVDEGASKNHTLDIVDGYQFNRGVEAQDRFFNNNERTKFEAENVHVVMYDGKLNQPAQAIHVLEVLYKHYAGKMPPVLFVANEFSSEVLQVLLINKAEGNMSFCAVRSPNQTKVTTVMLDDMAVYLGGERLGNGNRNLNNIEFDDIGIASKVTIDKYTTTFYGGQGDEESVKNRIEQLKAQRNSAESPYDGAIISDRIASLAEGIAKIGVGGMTDLEVKEKYHRIEDAINASRAAIEEGVIPGGGATLYRFTQQLEATTYGEGIVQVALQAPMQMILSNLGYNESEQLNSMAAIHLDKGSTWDGVSGAFVKAVEAGIIDPVKVTKTALRNACSIASLLSTCGGSITFSRKQ